MWRAFVIGGLLIGCSSPAETPGSATEPSAATVAPPATTGATVPPATGVAPTEVTIVGELTDRERVLVEWALERFELADLRLPAEIEVAFTDDRSECHGRPASCQPGGSPPHIAVCAPDGENAQQLIDRRIAVLHELAHVWHYAQRDNGAWPDFTDIVGGSADGSETCWEDRMEERVAVAISWGLLDQFRRPVKSDLPCVTLYQQFVALTGHLPLEPVDIVCVPPPE